MDPISSFRVDCRATSIKVHNNSLSLMKNDKKTLAKVTYIGVPNRVLVKFVLRKRVLVT
jgi:hypothetical protein